MDKHLLDNCSPEVQLYIKGLKQMLEENATTINQHEELLDLQETEIEGLRNEVDALEYSLSNERCL